LLRSVALKSALLRRISAAPRGAVIGKNFNLLYFLTLLSIDSMKHSEDFLHESM